MDFLNSWNNFVFTVGAGVFILILQHYAPHADPSRLSFQMKTNKAEELYFRFVIYVEVFFITAAYILAIWTVLENVPNWNFAVLVFCLYLTAYCASASYVILKQRVMINYLLSLMFKN